MTEVRHLGVDVSSERRPGTTLHTSEKEDLRGVQSARQAGGASSAAGDEQAPAHWEPCRGGCGTAMPPGQKCFSCAAAAVATWKAAQAIRRVVS